MVAAAEGRFKLCCSLRILKRKEWAPFFGVCVDTLAFFSYSNLIVFINLFVI